MSYRIGEVAEMVGMTVEGLRYYERRGLVEPSRRASSGYRLYGQAQLDRLHFIKAAQEMGFSLDEIQDLLEIREGSGEACIEVRDRLQAKLETVHRRIELLQAMKVDLADALQRCQTQVDAGGSADECPVLDRLGSSAVAEAGDEPTPF